MSIKFVWKPRHTAAIAARIAAQYAPPPVKAKSSEPPKYEKDKRKYLWSFDTLLPKKKTTHIFV
jgi:hypothetical protein